MPTPDLAKSLTEQYIYDNQESYRYHLGASIIGGDCERAIWYGWRWFKDVKHPHQLLRLFKRGHYEEPIVLGHLRNAGMVVHEVDSVSGKQFQLSALGGHFGGSLDAVLENVPGLDGKPCLMECKTANQKQFDLLVKKGVRVHKFEHYVQMQIYMGAYNLPWALYICVNKNTDEWHWELIIYDKLFNDQYLQRAANIIASDRPPQRVSNDPSWYRCKWCDYYKICHHDETPAKNCRTCVHSDPRSDGRWYCTKVPHLKIRTKDESEAKGEPIDQMPCMGLDHEYLQIK